MDARIKAFETLYDDNADAIFRHLYFRLGDRERAKELAQEVFMRTWQHLVSGGELVYPRAFLFRVAHNLFVNEIRTDKRTTSLDTLQETYNFEPADQRVSVAADIAAAELHRQLARLPEADRSVLVMRYVDGMLVKDIAELLEEQETTISMRIARARDKLRTLYEGPTASSDTP